MHQRIDCGAQGEETSQIYVIDDHEEMREAVATLLEGLGHTVRQFHCALCFLSAVTQPQGVIILDLRLPGMSGLRLIKQLKLPRPGLEVIFMSGTADVDCVIDVMKIGASDFLVKPFRDQSLLDALDEALSKSLLTSRRAAVASIVNDAYKTLSPAERLVARYVKMGLLNKQIAGLTGRSLNTIKVHRSHIMQKMNLNSSADLFRTLQEVSIDDFGNIISENI